MPYTNFVMRGYTLIFYKYIIPENKNAPLVIW
jgi:hypothetical protein